MANEVYTKERVLSHFNWFERLFVQPKLDKMEADILTLREYLIHPFDPYQINGSKLYTQVMPYCQNAKQFSPCAYDALMWVSQQLFKKENYGRP